MHESASGHEFPYSSDDAIAEALNHQRSQGLHQSASRCATLLSARLYESRVKRSAPRPRLLLQMLQKTWTCCLVGAARRSFFHYAFRALRPCTLVPLQGRRRNTFPLSCLLCLSPSRSHAAHCICVLCATSCVRLWIVGENNGTFFPSLKGHLNHLALGRKNASRWGGAGGSGNRAPQSSDNIHSSACDDSSPRLTTKKDS